MFNHGEYFIVEKLNMKHFDDKVSATVTHFDGSISTKAKHPSQCLTFVGPLPSTGSIQENV